MPGQPDVVRDEMTVEGRAGDATTSPSGRHNMLVSNLCNGMESTQQMCGSYRRGVQALPGRGLGGKAAVQRDLCKLEERLDRFQTNARSSIRESFTPAILQPGDPSPQKSFAGQGGGTPKFCGGQLEHKSALHPCGSRA